MHRLTASVSCLGLAVVLAGCLGAVNDSNPEQEANSGSTIAPPSIDEDLDSVGAPLVTNSTDGPFQFEVAVQHGSAGLRGSPPWTSLNVTVRDEGGAQLTWTAEAGSNFTVPFLEPSMNYSLVLRAIGDEWESTMELELTTPANPRGQPKPDEVRVQPGVGIQSPSGCTLGFLARGPTNDTLYALTAGHCVENAENQEVHLRETGERIGIVRGFGQAAGNEVPEWAVIELDFETVAVASPSVRGTGGPTGLGFGYFPLGSPVCYSGAASTFSSHDALRSRCGLLAGANDDEDNHAVFWLGAGYVGDSGSSVLESESGRAIALLSGFFGPVLGGYSLCGILEAAWGAGFPLKLLTDSEYEPPVLDQSPVPRVPAPYDDLNPNITCPDWMAALHA